MRNKVKIVITIFLSILILFSLVPTSMAKENIKIYDLEELKLDFDINKIDKENISDEKANEIAIAMREAIEKEIQKDLDESTNKLMEQYTTEEYSKNGAATVNLGQNRIFTTANTGDNGTSK